MIFCPREKTSKNKIFSSKIQNFSFDENFSIFRIQNSVSRIHLLRHKGVARADLSEIAEGYLSTKARFWVDPAGMRRV